MKSNLEILGSRLSGIEARSLFTRAVATAILATGCSASFVEGKTVEGDTESGNEGCIFSPADTPLSFNINCNPERLPEGNFCSTYVEKAMLAASDAQAVEESDGYAVMKSCSTHNGHVFQSGYDWFDENTSVGDALRQVVNNEPPEKLTLRCTMVPAIACLSSKNGGDTWQELVWRGLE